MTASKFLDNVRALCGLYNYDECDCMTVIRKALNISFSGTNWLFRSVNNASKYRYLSERHKMGDGTPPPGAILFKTRDAIPPGYSDKPDAYHCGVLDNDGYVIHSSPSTGPRKDYNSRADDWQYWGLMKQVDYEDISFSGESGNGGNSSVNNLDIPTQSDQMTDRQLLEAIYNAVVRD